MRRCVAVLVATLTHPPTQHAKQAGKWPANNAFSTVEQADAVYDVGATAIVIPDRTEKGRKRRTAEMKWTTLVREFLPKKVAAEDDRTEERAT